MMFIQWHKIEGHSNPDPRKGFSDSKNLLRGKQLRGKGMLQPGEDGGFNAAARRRDSNFQKILRATGMLFLLITLAVLVFVFKKLH